MTQHIDVKSNGIAGEAARLAKLKAASTPPDAMLAAPMAPARGPMQIIDDFTVTAGGIRTSKGRHWRQMCQLEVICAKAAQRHAARKLSVEYVAPFTARQIATGRDYAGLAEWRDGSAMKCATPLLGRTGGGQGGLFIDTFIDQGRALASYRTAIGSGMALDMRRHMDRGNGRRALSVLALVDEVLIAGRDLSAVLRAYGWSEKGVNRAALVAALAGALDRMYGDL